MKQPSQIVADRARRIGIFAGLCWLYACIHLNRQSLAVLADSVKSDLALNDASLGALTGSAFSLVYALLGLWFGRRADQSDRIRLVQVGGCVWSLGSLGAAWAPSYMGLVAARAGVATGEAIATAAAFSLVGDLAGERYRARALSVFLASAFAGIGCAAWAGGEIVGRAADIAAVMGVSITGWRLALCAAAVPGVAGAVYLSAFDTADYGMRAEGPPIDRRTIGLLCAAAAATVAVQMIWPAPIGVPAAVGLTGAAAVVWSVRMRKEAPLALKATLGCARFRWFLLAFAIVLFVDSAATFWLLPFVQRRFGLDVAWSGERLGIMLLAGGGVGCLAGGWIADRWQRVAGHGRVATAGIAFLVEALSIMAAVSQPERSGFLVWFLPFCVSSGAWAGLAAAIGLDLVPREHRSSAVAVYFLITTVSGPALGPFVAGVLSSGAGSIGRALFAICAVAPVALFSLARLARTRDSRMRG